MMDKESIDKFKIIVLLLAVIWVATYFSFNIFSELSIQWTNQQANNAIQIINYSNIDPITKKLDIYLINYTAQQFIQANQMFILPITPLQFIGIESGFIGLYFILNRLSKNHDE